MGKFTKGQSGNPGGRPGQLKELRELAREHTEESVNAIVTVMRNMLRKKTSPIAARVVVEAACALFDRGYGKPMQTQHTELLVEEKNAEVPPFELGRRIAMILDRADRHAKGEL